MQQQFSLSVPTFPSSSFPSAAETALADSIKTDHDLRCPCYCEENVWRLAYRKMRLQKRQPKEEYYVVFISNRSKCVAMFYQKASRSPAEKPCFWDYHVILVGVNKASNLTVVYDVDTTIDPYPKSLHQYLALSFGYPDYLSAAVEMPLFRVIPAQQFLDYFESDRSHMFNLKTGEWIAPPPNYQCIMRDTKDDSVNNNKSKPRKTNLHLYLNFENNDPLSLQADTDIPDTARGKIMTLDEIKNYNWPSY